MARLSSKKRYLQISLNGDLSDARQIINNLPASDRIIIEAGTPLIKQYGAEAISRLNHWWQDRLFSAGINAPAYIVADLKTIDRGATEARLAASAGASAAVAMGQAPTETLNSFVAECENLGVDAMIDMMNVEYSLNVLRQLKKQPAVVILHRGVDEQNFNREKQIPYHEICRVKGNYDIMLAIAGGDTPREVQRAFFNSADIAVVWKNFYTAGGDTVALAQEFLRQIK